MSIINALIIGDLHIGSANFELTKLALEKTVEYAQKLKEEYKFIVLMGDIMHKHNNLTIICQEIAYDFLTKLSEIGKKIFLIIGNHDRVNNRDICTNKHPFIGWKINNLIIVNTPQTVTTGGTNLLFMPYLPPGTFIDIINKYIHSATKKGLIKNINKLEDYSLIFAHQEFKGCTYGPVESMNGDMWEENYPMIISGHIHNKGFLKDNIFYTGSLYPTTISESYDKGVILGTFDITSKKFTYTYNKVIDDSQRIFHIKANNIHEINEMLNLDRKNVKYIIKGTRDEVASLKDKIRGKKLKIAYDICPDKIEIKSRNFDDILKELIGNDKGMMDIITEII